MAKISNVLSGNPIAAFCTFFLCCTCLNTDYGVICSATNSSCTYEIDVDVFAVRNNRKHMEDRYFIEEEIAGTNVSLFAVFDGHGGKYVSSKAKKRLMPRIRSKIQEIYQLKHSGTSRAPTYEILDPHSAEYYIAKFGVKNNSLVHAFKEMLYDEIMSFDEAMLQMPRNDYCGSTAVIAILTGHHLIVANVGDSRAVLGNTSDEAIRITKDHKPDDPDEKVRIESVPNGKVTFRQFDVPRVNNILAMSRALGDHALKRRKLIVATPDMFVIDFKEPKYDPKYLVIATDGIWDVLSDQEVIDSINEYSNNDDEDVARKISQDAISWYSHDNIAILIISFERKGGCEEEEEEDDDDEDGNEIEEIPWGKRDEL